MEDEMNTIDSLTLADDLQLAGTKIIKKQQPLDAERVYKFIDSLAVLDKPISAYFTMKQEDYYENESDKKLTLQHLTEPLADMHDRILTNHVDGYVQNDEINFTYNHEDPYADDYYSRKTDFHVLSYSLKVVTAMIPVIGADNLKTKISKDAILSIGLAAYNLTKHN